MYAIRSYYENAFLKILEEPPADTVILLVSHNPGRLLPTTRSRCRVLALKPLAPTVITSYSIHYTKLYELL